MPKSPDSEGVPRLMTVSEIALEHGVSRQTVHSYRTRGSFPKPVEGEGSTRPRFRADEVAAWFAANPPRPGKRTDLAPQPDEGAAMPASDATIDEQVTVPRSDLNTLLAVATLYLESFTDDEQMTLPEKLGIQDVEGVVEKYGRRY